MNIVERLREDAEHHLDVARCCDCDPKHTVNYKHYKNNLEAANEIEQLREALNCVILYWDEWKDASDNHPTALSLEEVVLIARDSLKE